MNDLFIECELPEPFSEEEILAYLEKIREGDLVSRDELICHNLRLVLYIVKENFTINPSMMSDLVGVGVFGLMKAIDHFDTNRNTTFSNYAAKCIMNEIRMFLRKEQVKNKYFPISIDEKVMYQEEMVSIGEIIPDEETDFLYDYLVEERHEVLKKIIEELPLIDQTIIKYYCIDEMSQSEIAQLLQISEATMSRKMNALLTHLRQRFKDYGYDLKEPEKKTKPETIYEFFPTYSNDEVDTSITKLPIHYQTVLQLYYGSDLCHLVVRGHHSKKEQAYFRRAIKKMEKILKQQKEESDLKIKRK